jgi:hypothetical protein
MRGVTSARMSGLSYAKLQRAGQIVLRLEHGSGPYVRTDAIHQHVHGFRKGRISCLDVRYAACESIPVRCA